LRLHTKVLDNISTNAWPQTPRVFVQVGIAIPRASKIGRRAFGRIAMALRLTNASKDRLSCK
jgi:hypothetical protein